MVAGFHVSNPITALSPVLQRLRSRHRLNICSRRRSVMPWPRIQAPGYPRCNAAIFSKRAHETLQRGRRRRANGVKASAQIRESASSASGFRDISIAAVPPATGIEFTCSSGGNVSASSVSRRDPGRAAALGQAGGPRGPWTWCLGRFSAVQP
jgi:hypothetical protein